jgi:transposase
VPHGENATTTATDQHVAQLEAKLVEVTTELGQARDQIARLRSAYTRALEQLALMRRRIFSAKAERFEAAGLQLSFEKLLAEVRELESKLVAVGDVPADVQNESEQGDAAQNNAEKAPGSTTDKPGTSRARRDLSKSSLPLIRVEVPDPELEGAAERIGFEESYRLGYERGGPRRILVARVVYKVVEQTDSTSATGGMTAGAATQDQVESDAAATEVEQPKAVNPVITGHVATDAQPPDAPTAPAITTESEPAPTVRFVTAPLPKELFRRSLLAPALVSHLLIAKFMMGVPFYRLEEKFELEGFALDRSTMCRYSEDAGATLAAIVEAARREAFETAFCLSTDATGVSVQPGPLLDGKRRPCRKGHFFVILADLEVDPVGGTKKKRC